MPGWGTKIPHALGQLSLHTTNYWVHITWWKISHDPRKIASSQIILYMCVHAHLLAQSCPTLCNPMDCSLVGFSVHGDFPGKSIGVGCHVLLQGIFPTQGLNPGLLHCSWTLYHLSHQVSLLEIFKQRKPLLTIHLLLWSFLNFQIRHTLIKNT